MIWETVTLVAVMMLVIMAARKRRKRRAKLVYIPVNTALSLSTLADNAVIKGTMQAVFTRRFRVVYVKGYWSLRGGTATEGPISIGMAHSDYSVAEIVEATDAAVISSSEKIAGERAKRLVRKVGSFPGLATNEELRGNKGGEAVYTKLNWAIEEDFSLDFWAQNRSGGGLTGGQVLEFDGNIVGRWE